MSKQNFNLSKSPNWNSSDSIYSILCKINWNFFQITLHKNKCKEELSDMLRCVHTHKISTDGHFHTAFFAGSSQKSES